MTSLNRLLIACNSFAAFAVSVLISGCASNSAQKHAEEVAKGWCMTIRASQVVPVYPLTSDLIVGDVFLVSTPISTQEKQYQERGFLPLDDHVYRIPFTNFSNVYFDGYWKDTFGRTPHEPSSFTNSGPIQSNASLAFTSAPAPRAAFPTYSFEAQSGFGLSAAFPIDGIPVALNWLGTDQVSGSVSISDARTYAGDESNLLELVKTWAANPKIHDELAATARSANPEMTYLRVVTRIYMARGMEVSLFRAQQRGGGARAGVLFDNQLPNSTTNFASLNSNLVSVVNAMTNLLSAAQAGGSLKFSSTSHANFGIAETFDQLLAIGYLGFDVPVFESGSLGTPIPTFQHLSQNAKQWIIPIFDTRDSMKTLYMIADKDPARAITIMAHVVGQLQAREFRRISFILSRVDPTAENRVTIKPILSEFRSAVIRYFATPNLFRIGWGSPQRLKQFNDAFDKALSLRVKLQHRDGEATPSWQKSRLQNEM